MSRSTALTYYSQDFKTPTTTYDAESASNVFLWMSLTFLCIPLFFGVIDKLRDKDVGVSFAFTVLIALVSRIAWLITLSIIFHRVQVSW